MAEHFRHPRISADAGSMKARVIALRTLVALDADPEKQETLRRLLIEEEDRLAIDRERLDKSARLIRKGQEQLREGKEHIRRLDLLQSAGDNRDYNRTLELMEAIQQLYENFHRRSLDVYPYRIKLHDEVVGVCATLDEARRRAQQFADANPEVFVTVVDARQGRSETFYQESPDAE